MNIIVYNGRVITPDGIIYGGVSIHDGKIVKVFFGNTLEKSDLMINAHGNYISPGFIDIHIHGGGGHDVSDCSKQGILQICKAHAEFGTTSIVPTVTAAPMSDMIKAVETVKSAADGGHYGANILGVHLEGPYLSPNQKDPKKAKHLRLPDKDEYMPLLNAWDKIKIMGSAPEFPGAYELAELLHSRGIVASIAHSDATFEEVETSLQYGFSDVTHIYSGCSTMHRKEDHRYAGVVEAGLLLDKLTVQVLADGKYLPIPFLRLLVKCKGYDRIALITNAISLAASELTEGETYVLKDGTEAVYSNGVMKLPDSHYFTGSVATMNVLVRNMVKFAGVDVANAIKMASSTPAKIINEPNKGTIEYGKDADIIIFDDEINVTEVIIGGDIF